MLYGVAFLFHALQNKLTQQVTTIDLVNEDDLPVTTYKSWLERGTALPTYCIVSNIGASPM